MNRGLYGFGNRPDLGYSGWQLSQLTRGSVGANVPWSRSSVNANPLVGTLLILTEGPACRKLRMRGTRFWSSTGQTLSYRVNGNPGAGDSGANYSRQDISSTGTTAAASQLNAGTGMHAGYSHSSGSVSTYMPFNFYYPDELRSTGAFIIGFTFDRPGGAGTMYYRMINHLYLVPGGARSLTNLVTGSIGNYTYENFYDYSTVL